MLLAKDVDIIRCPLATRSCSSVGKRLPTTNWQSLNLKAPLKKIDAKRDRKFVGVILYTSLWVMVSHFSKIKDDGRFLLYFLIIMSSAISFHGETHSNNINIIIIIGWIYSCFFFLLSCRLTSIWRNTITVCRQILTTF